MTSPQSDLNFLVARGLEHKGETEAFRQDGSEGNKSDPNLQALELLRQDARDHQNQVSQTGLVGRAIASATEFWHQTGSTGQKVVDLEKKLSTDIGSGNSAEASRHAQEARELVAADQAALRSRGLITGFGVGVVEGAGMFMAGRKGFALAAGTAALEAIKPGSQATAGEQATDVALGVTRAVALKGAYLGAARMELGMASTAVGLGVVSRATDLTLNRSTYQDGAYAQRIWNGITDKKALASDVVTMVVARGALGKIDRATDGALTNSRMWSNVAVGGVFGLTKGGTDELIHQGSTGKFDVEQLALKTALSGASGAAGAAFGSLPGIREARSNFAGSANREYQISATTGQSIAEILAASKTASVLTRVREVRPNGVLGPEQGLLVQHVGKDSPVNTRLAGQADLIASCEPNSLPAALRGKHIMPETASTLWMTQKPNGRLSFSDQQSFGDRLKTRVSDILGNGFFGGYTPGRSLSVALGDQPVSKLLTDPSTRGLLRYKDTHDLGLYADILKNFKTPARRVIDGGADSVVLELADRNILKITHLDWNPEWGKRTYEDSRGNRFRFDARIIGEPHTVKRPDGIATYYVQERAETPVSQASVDLFSKRLQADGRYYFTDADPSQLGYTKLPSGQRGLVLLDYDAVQTPQAVQADLRRQREDRYGY